MKKLLLVTVVCANDYQLALKRAKYMTLWGTEAGRVLLLVNDGTVNEEDFQALAQAYLSVFSEVIQRKIGTPRDPRWPAGVNHVFRTVARLLTGPKRIIDTAPYSGWFFFEPDVTPLSPMWLGILDQQYTFNKRPFMGVKSRVHATKENGQKVVIECMNGAGAYPFEAVHYTPQMMLTDGVPWDVAGLGTSMQHKIAYIPDSAYVLTYGVTKCRKQSDGALAATKTTQDGTVSDVSFGIQGALLHHGCKDGSLMDLLTFKQPDPKPTISAPPPSKPKARTAKAAEPVIVSETAIIAEFTGGATWNELIGKYKISPVRLKKILQPVRG